MIKPAYSVSFLLSINIFVWQNVLYFLDAPRKILLLCRYFLLLLMNVKKLWVEQRSWDSPVCVADRLMAGELVLESRQDQKCVSAPKISTLSLGPAEPLTEWVLVLFRGRKTSVTYSWPLSSF